MKKQYIIQELDKEKRRQFYEYITNNFDFVVKSDKDHIVNSSFPFVIDFKEKNFWVCESITCCACAAQKKRIITIKDFKERI